MSEGKLTWASVLFLLVACLSALAQVPENDNCPPPYGFELRQNVAFEGNTSMATTDGSASCRPTNSGKDVWHYFVPICTGVYTIDTCGSGFDVVLSVHDSQGFADCGTSNNTFACLDDGSLGGAPVCPNALHPSMNVFLEKGRRYLIRVAGFGNPPASGSYRILVTPSSRPSNDDCADAAPVSDGQWPFSVCSATNDFFSLNACVPMHYAEHDIWYSYTASCDGEVVIDTCNSNFDTVLMVYPGTACPVAATVPLACNDNLGGCGLFNWFGSRVVFSTTAGEQFLVRVAGGKSSLQAGSGTLNISCQQVCPSCAADYNQDGGVDGTDVDSFFADWEQGLPCADVSGDGGVDGSDVAFFFIFWENGGCE